ncbi:hypothetical protein ACMGDH_06215 [Sphingomonas sp. DT-207]|uniref:hypothetical protein n=1 Tax=Sphingomonas sp. DT-207 TaxID=3396167 RepID=UPI003F1ABB09
MHQRVIRATRRYETTIDRTGIALGVGSLLAGAIILVLLMLGGQRDPLALVSGWMLGVALSACAITAVAGPLWLALHVAGLRRAHHAALVGAITAMAVFVGAQTYGFGLYAMPLMDDRTWLYRLASAVATSALLAAVAALIGVAMWRVAYRPREEED